MNSQLSNLIQRIRRLPVWARIVTIVIVAAAAAVVSFTSCSTIRTTMTSSGQITTSVRQNVLDSTSVSISLFRKE